jgi:ABC-type transport system substrate-binding protein
MPQIPRTIITSLALLALLVPMIAACGTAAPPEVTREVVVVTSEPEPAEQATVVVTDTADDEPAEETPTEEAADAWTTPHPILGELQFRQAFAYCTDRLELISSVYPFLSEEEQQGLLMDTFLPQGHWALAPEDQITTYPFDPEQGQQLLDEMGWELGEGTQVRTNDEGEPLAVEFTTTNAQFRQTWAAVLEQQLLENCGIQLVRTHAPGSWWFGSSTGLQRRDFELGAYAWVGQADPTGTTLYACDQIPLPSNNWEGQNYMGWCNEEASDAIYAANNTLDREERIEQYAIVQREFTADMVSLPLFNRFEAAAATTNLLNFQPDPTIFSYVANVDEWEMADGSDTVVIGLTQEPSSLFLQAESALVANIAGSLMKVVTVTSYGYDYQPAALEELPTIENGGTTDTVVEVSAGDEVWTGSEAVELGPDVEVLNAEGELVTYEGEPIEMRQLAVTFELPEGLTWEDGEPVTQEDIELAYNIRCDPQSGAVTYTTCNSIQEVTFNSDTSYTITYLPGTRWSEYFAYSMGVFSNLFTVGAYPAHRELSEASLQQLNDAGFEVEEGSTLADVPASEWSTLTEVAEQPLSYGPYMLVSWEKGQRMTFEANPNYYKGELPIKTIIIEFFEDTNQAVAQLRTGNLDIVGQETLGAGPELETVLAETDSGALQVVPLTSPTWEHIDFNLYIP